MPAIKTKFKKKYTNKKKAVKSKITPPKFTRHQNMVSMGAGFPKKIQMTHRYMENGSVTSTTGILGKFNYSCNNLYDPNVSGGGHQPMYFDQLGALYDHYIVIGSKIDVKVLPYTSTQAATCVGILMNDDSTTTPTDYTGCNEQTTSVYKYLPVGATHGVSLSAKWSAKKTFGGGLMANTSLSGTPSTGPSENTNFTIYCSTMDGASSASVYLEVTITYIAIWYELKDLGQS